MLFLQRKYKSNMAKIIVNDTEITILAIDEKDYISLTEMVKGIENGLALIEKWLRNKKTIEFLGIWEEMYNPNFNSPEFEGIKNAAGLNRFILSVKQWIEKYKDRIKELNRIAIQQMMVLEEVETKKLLK